MTVRQGERVEISPQGEISFSEQMLQALGWKQGDKLYIDVVDGRAVMLSKRPRNVAARYAGAFTDLYPDPDDTRRFLDEGRGYSDDNEDIER